MALLPTTGGSAFPTQIIGINSSILSASYSASLTRASLSTLSVANQPLPSSRQNEAVTLPPGFNSDPSDGDKSITERVREVREQTSFIRTDNEFIRSVNGNVDREASFVLFQALSDLRTLAEYASEDNTPASSLDRLNKQFQKGLEEVRGYISSTETDKLDIFLGNKTTKVETAIRTGKNSTEFGGSFIAASKSDVIEGLTGSEQFNLSITKNGEADTILIDFAGISGDLSIENIVNHINSQIEAVTDTNDEGGEFIKHQTRVHAERDEKTGKFGFGINATVTEKVSLTPVVSEPTLYVASSVTGIESGDVTKGRLTEINNLTGTLTVDDTFNFAGIDLSASEFAKLTADNEDKDADIDPRIVKLRDQFRKDALEAVTDSSSTDEVEDTNENSITNLDSENIKNANTTADQVAVTSDGGVFVVGTSQGSFGHQINTAETQDVFLTRFDSQGNVLFSRLLGASDSAEVFDVVVDSNDNVIITGQTDSKLASGDAVNSSKGDAFVAKFSETGDEVFRYQLDTFAESGGQSIAVDSNDDIFIGGYTKSAIGSGTTHAGGNDALIIKLSGTDGSVADRHVFGTSGNEKIKGIAVDSNDNLVVATEEDSSAVVYRIFGADLSNQTGTINFGALGNGGSIKSLTIDNDNNAVYVAGVTTNSSLDASGAATVNGTSSGKEEGFVSGASLSGVTDISADFTTYLSTSGSDDIADVVVHDGNVFVAGSTSGVFSGEDDEGAVDGFVARVDGATGAVEDVQQFGKFRASSDVGAVAFTTNGNSVLETLGLPTGDVNIDEKLDIETQTSANAGDHFYISFDGGRQRKVTLEAGDDLKDISRKVRLVGLANVEVKISSTSEGDKLSISTKDSGVSINLTAGKDGQDLLAKLGIEAGKVLPRDVVFGLNAEAAKNKAVEDRVGGVFGLKLEGALNIEDKATAKYVLGLLDSAISTTQRAYRSLDYNPLTDTVKGPGKTGGAVSPQVSRQLANFQAGLNRLTGGGGASTVSLFA